MPTREECIAAAVAVLFDEAERIIRDTPDVAQRILREVDAERAQAA